MVLPYGIEHTSMGNGFKVQEKPEAIVKQVCNRPWLQPDNIDEFVNTARRLWDEEIRVFETPTSGDPFFSHPELVDVSGNSGISKHPSSSKQPKLLATLRKGSWVLNLNADGNEREFGLGVFTGENYAWHPQHCKRNVVALSGESGYKQWKEQVKLDLKDSLPWFECHLREHFPGQVFWSPSSCVQSERLLRTIPFVHLYRRMAFLVVKQ